MNVKEAKRQFVQAWGALGSQWGINKTMAQIHALMMVSGEELSTEDIMAELAISRGNVNMNIRELIDWGLVSKVFKHGERRDYFVAKIRKTRELDPILKLLEEIKQIDNLPKTEEMKHFQKMVKDVHRLALNVDRLIEGIFKAEENWFWDKILKLFAK